MKANKNPRILKQILNKLVTHTVFLAVGPKSHPCNCLKQPETLKSQIGPGLGGG